MSILDYAARITLAKLRTACDGRRGSEKGRKKSPFRLSVYTVSVSVHYVCQCTLSLSAYTLSVCVHFVCMCTLCMYVYTLCVCTLCLSVYSEVGRL